MKKIKYSILLIIVISAVSGALAAFAFVNFYTPESRLIKDFYLIENAVHVSPHSLRGKMDAGVSDFVLVDLRSKEEYDKEHIIGAINIPAYLDPQTSISLDSDKQEAKKMLDEFSALPNDRDIIVYCYSMPCMTGRKVGKLLAENGIYVKHLGIGWNEWRHFWNLWNHEGEWNSTDIKNYIASGSEPGMPRIREGTSCAKGGGC